MVKQTMKMEVRGTRAKGRPRMGWTDNIRHDMNKLCDLEEGDAQYRRRWWRMVQNPDLASRTGEEKTAELWLLVSSVWCLYLTQWVNVINMCGGRDRKH